MGTVPMKTIAATMALTLMGLFTTELVTGETEYAVETLMVAIDDGRDDTILLVPLNYGEASGTDGRCNPNVHRTRYE